MLPLNLNPQLIATSALRANDSTVADGQKIPQVIGTEISRLNIQKIREILLCYFLASIYWAVTALSSNKTLTLFIPLIILLITGLSEGTFT